MTIDEIRASLRDKDSARFRPSGSVYVDDDGIVVPQDSPRARYCVCADGGSIPASLARKLGLKRVRPQQDKALRPQEDKAQGIATK